VAERRTAEYQANISLGGAGGGVEERRARLVGGILVVGLGIQTREIPDARGLT